MKLLSAIAFFLLFTVLLGVGCWMASSGLGVWLLLVGVAVYAALFIKFGCQS